MPRLTVLMPVRNASSTVELAIRSTLRAMSGDAELCVFNDASSDESAALIEALMSRDSRLRLHHSDTNVGVATALNTLLDRTDSALVARMDADDVTLPWRFRVQSKVLNNRGTSVVFSNVIRLRGRLPLPQFPVGISPWLAPYALLAENVFAHSTLFAKRAVITDTGGYRVIPSEDYDLWLRLAMGGTRMRRTPIPCLVYREHQAQVTRDKTWISAAAQDTAVKESQANLAQRLCGKMTTDTEFDWSATLAESGLNSRERMTMRRLLKKTTANTELTPTRATARERLQ